MSSSVKWLVLLALLVGAGTSYGYGFSEGIWIFVVLGVLFELSFWVGVLRDPED